MTSQGSKKPPPPEPPRCPSQSALPKSRLIWEGVYAHPTSGAVPCRTVLAYTWALPRKAEEWHAEPCYVFEVAALTDAMGVPRFESKPLTDLPAAFFEDVIDALDRADAQPSP